MRDAPASSSLGGRWYFGRLKRYVAYEEREVKGSADLAEGAVFQSARPRVALEVTGEALTSAGFAKRIEEWSRRNKVDRQRF